ncbi:MAG: RNA 2',3'-cyclic phosphodiesterase [Clostridia bacterium]|nr:RNA 2',3'-cyclic phosphodiesterase [Clostridia bacterium]
MRCFLALPFSNQFKDYLLQTQYDIMNEDVYKVKWVEKQNFHLTLFFWQDIDEELIEKIHGILENLFTDIPPLTIRTRYLGFFPEKGEPKVIWVGLEKSRQLDDLINLIRKCFLSNLIPLEQKSFNPHITLGRLKAIYKINKVKELPLSTDRLNNPFSEKIHEVVLYQSSLQKNGPVYTIIKRYGLNNL